MEYLLDFGKRENIPPVVAKHGIKFEDPSSERNRYWLSECHVPLNLMRAYEAKLITRSLKKKDTDDRSPKKKDTNTLPKKTSDFSPKKPKRSRSVFDDLLEKAKKLPSTSRLCGQCFKTVTARYAIMPVVLFMQSMQSTLVHYIMDFCHGSCSLHILLISYTLLNYFCLL